MLEDIVIDPRIAGIAPGFRAFTVFADASDLIVRNLETNLLTTACDAMLAGEPPWAEAHLTSWSETYRKFGAKPNKTPCSAQALRRRVLRDGAVPSINPVVDLYNAVSLLYAIPIGGENYDAYVGRPQLTIADGTEGFDTVADGQSALENPAPGEVIWRDEIGVTCRRWNWRQCIRTRLDALTGRMWFVMEALETMPTEALHDAGNLLIEGLRQLIPGCEVSAHVVCAVDRS